MKYKKLICAGLACTSALALLAGCGKQPTAQQKTSETRMEAYINHGHEYSFVQSSNINPSSNTIDVKLKPSSAKTLKYWNTQSNQWQKLDKESKHQKSKALAQKQASHVIDKYTKLWKQKGQNGQVRAIKHLLEFGVLDEEVQKSGQYGRDKHLALDITNLPHNSIINKALCASAKTNYKQALGKEGIKGSRAKELIQLHKQEKQDKQTQIGKPTSHLVKTMPRQLNQGAKELDQLANAFGKTPSKKQLQQNNLSL